MMRFDAEEQEIYKFSVIVLDKGFPTFTSTVSVTAFVEDINDHAPILSSTSDYFAEIREGFYSDYFDIELVSLYLTLHLRVHWLLCCFLFYKK